MRFAFGETVTLHTRTVVGQDEYGNDVYGETSTPVSGVAVWPRIAAAASGTEQVQAQDQIVSGLWVLFPPEHDVTGVDAMTVRGLRYEADGEPGRYASPLTGTDVGYQVALKRVTG